MVKEQTQQRYVVKWCTSIPTDEDGDPILDAAVWASRTFVLFSAARWFAWRILRQYGAKLPWRIVRIELQEQEIGKRNCWERVEWWETTADGEEPYEM